MTLKSAHSHVNFQSLASDRAAYRLADQFDQDVLGYLSGYKQSALHANADTVNTTVNGTKATTAAGSDELLAAMKLDASDFNGGVAGRAIAILPRTGFRRCTYSNAGDCKPTAGYRTYVSSARPAKC